MKWPGKISSAFPSSEPFPALILFVTSMEERGVGSNPILSPETFRVKEQFSSLSEALPEVLVHRWHRIIQVLHSPVPRILCNKSLRVSWQELGQKCGKLDSQSQIPLYVWWDLGPQGTCQGGQRFWWNLESGHFHKCLLQWRAIFPDSGQWLLWRSLPGPGATDHCPGQWWLCSPVAHSSSRLWAFDNQGQEWLLSYGLLT